jgi:hypothetical protein
MDNNEPTEGLKKNQVITIGIIFGLIIMIISFWPRKYDACECYSYIRSNGTLTRYEMENMGVYSESEMDKQDYCLTKYSTEELIACY